MVRLSQVLAVEKGVRQRALAALTEAHRQLGKAPLLSGISRVYQPRDDDGEQLPAEQSPVQVNADHVLRQAADALTGMFDVVATREWGNTVAVADVVVGGVTLLPGVPVGYLLFLEKQLTDLRTVIAALPVLDPAERWSYDKTAGTWRAEPVGTTRTKKVPRNHVLAEATDRHPAQVQVYHEDVVVGTWTTVKFSGALPADRVAELLARVDALSRAVKYAREEANSTPVEPAAAGRAVFDYLLA